MISTGVVAGPACSLLCPNRPLADLLAREAGGLHRGAAPVAAAVALSGLRNSVAETGAGDRALQYLLRRPLRCRFPPPGGRSNEPVLAATRWAFGLPCPGMPLGSPKPARLNLLDRSIHRRSR